MIRVPYAGWQLGLALCLTAICASGPLVLLDAGPGPGRWLKPWSRPPQPRRTPSLKCPRQDSKLPHPPLAHTLPAEHRWIEVSDGRVTVYGVCPPDPLQRCRIEHRLACSAQRLPDLWPWLTMLRGENGRHAERQVQAEPEPPESPEEWPDAG
ncbi:DUF6083 domain-containing protein [Streptomyces sp. DSM 118148]|uniref:DUF6083 domain-containing protein n=1 Tax=Streptomyces sp. DSM 118148 TaxID=3448667 RepID=UPI00404024FB